MTVKRPVKVHRQNCRQGQAWLVKDPRTDLPIKERVKQLVLTDCEFYVSQLGRREMLATGNKIIHAWVTGDWLEEELPEIGPKQLIEVGYNPKRDKVFVRKDNGEAVYSAPRVYFFEYGVYIDP